MQNNNKFYRTYQMIILCEDSVNNESLNTFKEIFEKNLHQYDKEAQIESIDFNGNMKCAYNIEGKGFANVVNIKFKLLHTDNMGQVITNMRRKYHKSNQAMRNVVLYEKNSVNFSDIANLRKQVEANIY